MFSRFSHKVSGSCAIRSINTRQQLAFWLDLFKTNPGTIANVSSFLHEHAQSGDKLITNYEWEPLYFHTRLPQALKILPDYPIYAAAKSKGLPSYTVDVDQARWQMRFRYFFSVKRCDGFAPEDPRCEL